MHVYVYNTGDYVADTTSTTSTSDEGTSKEAKIAMEEVELQVLKLEKRDLRGSLVSVSFFVTIK